MTEDLQILYAVLLKLEGKVSKIKHNSDGSYSVSLICQSMDNYRWWNIAKVRLVPNEG